MRNARFVALLVIALGGCAAAQKPVVATAAQAPICENGLPVALPEGWTAIPYTESIGPFETCPLVLAKTDGSIITVTKRSEAIVSLQRAYRAQIARVESEGFLPKNFSQNEGEGRYSFDYANVNSDHPAAGTVRFMRMGFPIDKPGPQPSAPYYEVKGIWPVYGSADGKAAIEAVADSLPATVE